MESVADRYYGTIKSSRDPAYELALIYCELLGKSVDTSTKKVFNRLVELFGAQRVTVALVTLGTRYDELPKDNKRLEYYLKGILLNSLKEEYREDRAGTSTDLTDLAEQNKELVENKRSNTFIYPDILEDDLESTDIYTYGYDGDSW